MRVPPFPWRDVVVTTHRLLFDRWRVWFNELVRILSLCPSVSGTLGVSGVSTAVTWPVVTVREGGLYRVSASAWIETPATTSSALGVSVSVGGRTSAGSVVTSNALGASSFSTLIASCVSGDVVEMSASYSTSGATPMSYAVRAVVELVSE